MLSRARLFFTRARARRVAVLAAASASVSLAGCPSGTTTGGEPPATCAKVGDPCTFAPGKLGLCITAVDGATLICQSQH